MYKSSLRHIHDPVLLPLKVEVFFHSSDYIWLRLFTRYCHFVSNLSQQSSK